VDGESGAHRLFPNRVFRVLAKRLCARRGAY
jgi:hypothetical protein